VIAILFTTPPSPSAGLPWQAVALLAVVMVPLFWFLGFYHAVVRFLRSRIMGHVAIGLGILAVVLYAYCWPCPPPRTSAAPRSSRRSSRTPCTCRPCPT
jgi:FlaA1/EpsC-like NDP-sugar epimerase